MPNTPCLDAIRASWRYMATQLSARPGPYAALFASAPWRASEAALDTAALSGDLAALSGDLAATQAACRALWTLALAYVPTQEEEAHGST